MNKDLKCCLLVIIFSLFGWSCSVDIPQDVTIALNELPEKVDFNIHVKPIISDRCYQCHGPDEQARKAQLRFDGKEGLFAKTASGNHAFVPGNLNKSEAIRRILSDDPEYMMPPPDANRQLNAKEKAALVKWIKQGGEWKGHWAFISPQKPEVPSAMENWPVQNPIDNFIQEKLHQNQLQPSSEAEKYQLLRRVTMDLTGLPPTIEEIDAFIQDTAPDAYESVVDRLLQTDAYAERMALEWLDLARYADSHGFHADGIRTMWPWRDWVIEAFKKNMPYNQFVTEQLAGDLMPQPSKDQIIATAFNRNHPMTAEGGAIDEEFRLEYVSNRTNTLGKAFLGVTIECARCHDHKFDPISQNEYYQLSAFFNNIKELGMTGDDGDYGPMVWLTSQKTDEKINAYNDSIRQLEKEYQLEKDEIASITDFVNAVGVKKIKPVLFHSFDKVTKTDSSQFLDDRSQTVHRHVELKEGKSGQSLYFDHQDDEIYIGKFGEFEGTEPFSAALWVNQDKDNGKTKVLMGNAGEKNSMWRGWEFYLDSINRPTLRLISSKPHNYLHVRTTGGIPLNSWSHVLFSYDGSSSASGIQIYVDGKKVENHIVYDKLYKSILPTNTERKRAFRGLKMGKSYRSFGGDNGLFKGYLDELVFFDRELLPNQVQSVYEQSLNGKMPVIYCPTDASGQSTLKKLIALRQEKLQLMDTISELMVMEEMSTPRPTFVLDRGEYDKPKEEVTMGTPGKILAFNRDYPTNRLGLSQWLFDRKNPLTARVAVNRYWQMIFGLGIVSTPSDFGSQGALPSHPRLLDWLATEFMDSGWDVKELIRTMVLSHTYRQDSKIDGQKQEKDPGNIYLSRGPSYRWQAEFIRDNALAASGLLYDAIGGESAKPYQPEGLWIELGNFSHFLLRYKQDDGPTQYRRSMYTFIRRTSPPPFMTLFDAPSREVCTISRERTNTPLQALVLLNDPQFQEASRALAYRLKNISDGNLDGMIDNGFKMVLSRPPRKQEASIIKELYEEQFTAFSKDKRGASEYLTVGNFKIPGQYDPVEMAALSVVSNTILNMDEVTMKR